MVAETVCNHPDGAVVPGPAVPYLHVPDPAGRRIPVPEQVTSIRGGIVNCHTFPAEIIIPIVACFVLVAKFFEFHPVPYIF
jgi:hypothetical protein